MAEYGVTEGCRRVGLPARSHVRIVVSQLVTARASSPSGYDRLAT
jgi:hypothetical protein